MAFHAETCKFGRMTVLEWKLFNAGGKIVGKRYTDTRE